MSERHAPLRRFRRSACVRGAAAMLAAALVLLPAACLCTVASAAPSAPPDATAHPCHGGDDQRMPVAPEHRPDCSHCQAGVALPAAAHATASLPVAAPVALVAAIGNVASAPWAATSAAAPRASHPPGRAVLRSKCVLLV